jgi:hypothetical protein
MSKPPGAVTLLDKDGNDRGDWIWCLSSESRPHAYGAYSEVVISLYGQEVRVTVSRRRKRVRVTVNHEEWTKERT